MHSPIHKQRENRHIALLTPQSTYAPTDKSQYTERESTHGQWPNVHPSQRHVPLNQSIIEIEKEKQPLGIVHLPLSLSKECTTLPIEFQLQSIVHPPLPFPRHVRYYS